MTRTVKIRYTKHALRRMRERKISKGQMALALREPDHLYRDLGLQVAERKTDRGNILRVYFREENGVDTVILVITVYRTRRWGKGRMKR